MKFNKKSLSLAIKYIIIFGLMVFVFYMSTIFMHQVMYENLIEPVRDSLLAAGQGTVTTEHLLILEEMSIPYSEDWLNYDLFFLLMFIGLFSGTLLIAAKTTKKSIWSFFGLISIGSMAILFIISLIEKVRIWLFENMIFQFIDTSSINTPIIDWFLNNLPMILFIWFLLVVLINQLDIINIFGAPRKIEEQEYED